MASAFALSSRRSRPPRISPAADLAGRGSRQVADLAWAQISTGRRSRRPRMSPLQGVANLLRKHPVRLEPLDNPGESASGDKQAEALGVADLAALVVEQH